VGKLRGGKKGKKRRDFPQSRQIPKRRTELKMLKPGGKKSEIFVYPFRVLGVGGNQLYYL
jgi:hypothetical protein